MHKIFESNSNGIVAAKEAKDSSGTLAVADSHTVILHRIEDGLEQSYRLKGAEGQIRLVEFAPDFKTLFFTTTLLNAVQAYSLSEARILEPGPKHESIPTVLGISKTSDLLISASETPPLVYLQNRVIKIQPLLLLPHASETPVVITAFHPDRPSIFLLAFADGTLACYDANKLLRSAHRGQGHPVVQGGESQTLGSLHAVTSRLGVEHINGTISSTCDPTRSSRNVMGRYHGVFGVIGALFVPGYRSRAVTCGADGQCRVVDFEKNQVIRSWHVIGPASALSLLSNKLGRLPLLAVGKEDGKLALYDTSGTLHVDIIAGATRIIDLEWMEGQSPQRFGELSGLQPQQKTCIDLHTASGSLKSRRTHPRNHKKCKASDKSPLEDIASAFADLEPQALGTVFHRPVNMKNNDLDTQFHAEKYMDLFSPSKPGRSPPPPPAASPRRRTTPRPRPRLLSSTFASSEDRSPTLDLIKKTPLSQGVGDAEGGAVSINEINVQHAIIDNANSVPTMQTNANNFPRRELLLARNPKIIKSPGKASTNEKSPSHLAFFASYMQRPKMLTRKMSSTGGRWRTDVKEVAGTVTSQQHAVEDDDTTSTHAVPASLMGGDDNRLILEPGTAQGDKKACMQKLNESDRGSRGSLWPGNWARAIQPQVQPSKALRPSIAKSTSPPVIGTPADRQGRDTDYENGPEDMQEWPDTSSLRHHDDNRMNPAETPSRFDSETSASFETLESSSEDDTTTLASPPRPLRPGFAQSYQGPVKVHRYLPRNSSLAWDHSPPASLEEAHGSLGSEQRPRDGVLHAQLDEIHCANCVSMQNEVRMLRDEIAVLRRIIKGKEREY